ncbi:MAG TPA: SIMPL domain-containing protein [Gaiellales bacterium]|nr:SIMPL domain-containing protein [Gaiellales bacterium]
MSRSYRTRSFVLAALAVALALALAFTLRGGPGPDAAFAAATAAPGAAIDPGDRTLTFGGSGDVKLQPDTALVNVSVHGTGTSSDEAQSVASDKMKTVLQALRTLASVHIADSDLETQGVYTSRDWEHEGRFISDQSLSVTLHDPARAGEVMAAATKAGADSVDGPSFSLAEQSAAYRDALRSALADARSKADAAAAAMGVRILGTTTISENSGGGGPIMYAADAAGKAASSAPPVQIGPVTVSAQVTVTFAYEA